MGTITTLGFEQRKEFQSAHKSMMWEFFFCQVKDHDFSNLKTNLLFPLRVNFKQYNQPSDERRCARQRRSLLLNQLNLLCTEYVGRTRASGEEKGFEVFVLFISFLFFFCLKEGGARRRKLLCHFRIKTLHYLSLLYDIIVL